MFTTTTILTLHKALDFRGTFVTSDGRDPCLQLYSQWLVGHLLQQRLPETFSSHAGFLFASQDFRKLLSGLHRLNGFDLACGSFGSFGVSWEASRCSVKKGSVDITWRNIIPLFDPLFSSLLMCQSASVPFMFAENLRKSGIG